jgi:hypothetical protein
MRSSEFQSSKGVCYGNDYSKDEDEDYNIDILFVDLWILLDGM